MFLIGCVVVVLLVAWACTMVFIVPVKHRFTLTLLGRYSHSAGPGLNFKLPWPFHSVDRKISTALLEMGDVVRVKTKDNAYVDMNFKVFYEVDEERIEQAAYNLEDPAKQMLQLAAKETRQSASAQTLDQLFEDKDTLEQKVMQAIAVFVAENGFRVKNVVVEQPIPSAEVQKASNEVIASARLLDAAKNQADAVKVERVGQATADAEALKLRAQAFADSRNTIAEGMAKAVETMQKSVSTLTESQVVSIMEGVDHREMIISASKSGSTIVLDTGGGGSRGLSGHAETTALVKAITKNGANDHMSIAAA